MTVCTHDERELFASERWAEPVFRACADHVETLACCLMPDHLHWLLRDAATMVPVVSGFKSHSNRLLWTRGLEGRAWQRSYWDHVVRGSESLEAVARYILANPVRKGLVREAGEYPYSMIRIREVLGQG